MSCTAESESSAASSEADKMPVKRGIYGFGGYGHGFGGYYGHGHGYYGGHGFGYPAYSYAVHSVPFIGHGHYHGHGFYH